MALKKIKCIGDFTLDHHLMYVKKDTSGARFSAERTYRDYVQLGGAGFTLTLLKFIKDFFAPNVNFSSIDKDIEIISKAFNSFPSTLSMINRMKSIDNNIAVRITDYIGTQDLSYFDNPKVDIDALKADYLFIHDFASYYKQEALPDRIFEKVSNDCKIFFRLSNFSSQCISKAIPKHFKQNTIVFLPINAIRRTQFRISQGLSWERTFLEIQEALKDIRLKYLNEYKFIVVVIDRFGFLVKEKHEDYRLIFRPDVLEENNDISVNGEIFGLTTSTMLHVLDEILRNDFSEESIAKGLKNGLISANEIYKSGFKLPEPNPVTNYSDIKPIFDFIFPFEKWEVGTESVKIADYKKFQLSKLTPNGSFITQYLPSVKKEYSKKKLIDVLSKGWKNELSSNFPINQFGDFVTADRFEIEHYHQFQTMIEEHFQKSGKQKPLSIMILGLPGSGKSFGVKEVAGSIEGLKGKIEFLEFNLSQIETVQELFNAFHRIQGLSLEGKKVITFWDELDTGNFRWLSYFLAPMQDAKFFTGADSHFLGAPIFIFACSKFEKWEKFVEFNPIKQIYKPENSFFPHPIMIGQNFLNIQEQESLKPAKPEKFDDFVSRIHGHIEVRGIKLTFQRKEIVDSDENKNKLIRRALVLRSILEKNYDSLFEKKDNGKDTSEAILTIDEASKWVDKLLYEFDYLYDVRSMESVIKLSHLSGKMIFLDSHLPSDNQLRAWIK